MHFIKYSTFPWGDFGRKHLYLSFIWREGMDVGRLIRRRRRELGLTQSALAERLGVTYQQVQKYEKGGINISLRRLLQLSEALQVPVEYFLNGEAEGASGRTFPLVPGSSSPSGSPLADVSCRVSNAFIQYVKQARPELLEPLLQGLPFGEAHLTDPDAWIPWDVERELERRLAELFGDEAITYRIGQSIFAAGSVGLVGVLSRLFSSPEQLIEYSPELTKYFTKGLVSVHVEEAVDGMAVVQLKVRGRQTRGACLFNQGMFSAVPDLFGLGPAEVREQQCVVPCQEVSLFRGRRYRMQGRQLVEELPGGRLKVVGRPRGGMYLLEGVLFGADCCRYEIRWRKHGRRVPAVRAEDKVQALMDAVAELERSYAKLQRAYDLLRSSEERYRTLMEYSGDAIFLLDKELGIKGVNRRCRELLGCSAGELTGRSFLELVEPAERNRTGRRLKEALGGRHLVIEVPVRFGPCRLLFSVSTSVVSEGEQPVGLMLSARDVTLEKEMSARLLEAERYAAKGVVAAEVAHEINNSLANVETTLFILWDALKTEHHRELLGEVREEVGRMSGIVKSILEVYRADDASLQEVDVSAEAAKVVELVRRRLSGRGVTVLTRLGTELPTLPCCPGHIKQILLNLLKNAEEALVDARARLIVVSTWADARHIGLRVEDTGCGMSPQQLKEVLSGGAYTSKAEGTGLGLAITRQIAARYGGLLRINSREGKGTAVEVLFPRRRGSSDEGAHTGG